MSELHTLALIDDLRQLAAETSWVEFKENNADPQLIRQTLKDGLIRPADPAHPRAGYVPFWA